MKSIRPLSNLTCSVLLGLAGITSVVQADTYTPPAGVPAPSFANNFVVIGDAGNGDDGRTGYGGVDYKYRVSATQITVGDWVDFLNDVDPNDTMGFGPIGSGCGNGLCFWAYEHNGSSWSVTGFTDDSMSMSATEAANLPIDWLSINMVARYMNWLATGDINNGAFTFSNTTSGNASITSFDQNYPGPRLPLEDEIYKAMFWNTNSNGYNDYPTTNISGGIPVIAAVDSSGIHNSNSGGALLPGYFGSRRYAQVGQETGNPWGLFDLTGNRHETTVEPGNLSATVLRGASAFDNPPDGSHSLYNWRDNLDAGTRYVSVGYRVWMGVSAASGTLSITKAVTGGTDSQNFSIQLDCDNDNFDVSNISLADGETYDSDNIPVGVQCTITETTPTPPSGFTYGAPQISPSNVTIGDGTNIAVTVTNPLQPQAAVGALEISKEVTGEPAGFTSPDYDIVIDCDNDAFDQTVTLQDGGSQTISNIPEGTVCSISEPSQPTAPAGYSYGSPGISPASVTIQGNQTSSVIVTNPLTPVATCTNITNTVSVTGVNETDSNNTNNSDDAVISVNCATPQVDLDLQKVVDKSSVISGDTLTYTLTLRNTGGSDATGVEVTDQLPAGVTYVSDTPSQGSYDNTSGVWTVGNLASNAQATLSITVTMD